MLSDRYRVTSINSQGASQYAEFGLLVTNTHFSERYALFKEEHEEQIIKL